MIEMRQITGWMVHLLTASGAVLALLSLQAIADRAAFEALLWLLLAFIVDGIDGPLARKVQVSEVLPAFDGALLDLIVDFLTYVFVPVVFIYQFEMLSEAFMTVGILAILVSSLYLFCNRNMKAQDNYFVGFPAIWNIVVTYLFAMSAGPAVTIVTVVGLSILSFVPIKTLHPLRVQRLRAVTLCVTCVWLLTTALVLIAGGPPNMFMLGLWIGTAVYFTAMSAWRTWSTWRRMLPD